MFLKHSAGGAGGPRALEGEERSIAKVREETHDKTLEDKSDNLTMGTEISKYDSGQKKASKVLEVLKHIKKSYSPFILFVLASSIQRKKS